MTQRILQLTSMLIALSLTRFTFAQVREVPQHLVAGVTFRVYDERRNPLADASVRGYGDAGGTVDLVTDVDGMALARFLRPGLYKVKAKDRAGHLGMVDLEVFPADRTKQIEIVT